MKEHARLPSLLPYLEPAAQCAHLSISLVSEDPGYLEAVPFPFVLVSDRDPFTSLLSARFETDSGVVLENAVLFVQKDNYRIPRDYPSQISNDSIEELWQKAFVYYSANRDKYPFITLSKQIGEDGKPLPFQPLFFCKAQKRFFHPPCPSCGSPLSLCRDDDLLRSSGLPIFSASMSRYLFCPSCSASGSGRSFYAYELGSYDSPVVKDRAGLIGEFNRLLKDPPGSSPFPCGNCHQNAECYGSEHKVAFRIVPFSFYPFFLLIFKSMPLKGSDFLSLVSGASWDDLEAGLIEQRALGRIHHLSAFKKESEGRSSFLFPEDDRFFLEVLYLKLTFLGEIAERALWGPASPQHFDPSLSLEGTWVGLTGKNSHLPYLWNFDLSCVDVSGKLSDLALSNHLPASYAMYSLGMTWFHTLLANTAQGATEVYQAVRDAIENQLSTAQHGSDNGLRGVFPPVFRPENLLWNPQQCVFHREWTEIWHECLNLGWTLIKEGFHGLSQLPQEEFQQKLRVLRERIKRELFAEKPRAVTPESPPREEAFRQVQTQMPQRRETEKAAALYSETTDETLVLPSSFSMEDTLPLDLHAMKQSEDFSETLIASPKRTLEASPLSAKTGHPFAVSVRQGEGDHLEDAADAEKTVIAEADPRGLGADLHDTIIAAPPRKEEIAGPAPATAIPCPGGKLEPKPVQKAEQMESAAEIPPAAEDELSMETVIIRPRTGPKPQKEDK